MPGRPCGGFNPVREVQLVEDVVDVAGGRCFGNDELFGDLAVGLAGGDEGEHLAFAGGERE